MIISAALRLDEVLWRTSHPERDRSAVAPLEIAVAGERPEWEELRVAVIAQVEHARKAGRGKAMFGPEAVRPLRARQIGDAARHRRMIDRAGRHQAEQGPRGLRGRARRRLIAPVAELVALPAFAPAAVGVLNGREPLDRPPHRRRRRIDPGRVERAERRPGAVDVVHAPAAEPTALRLLFGEKAFDAARQRWAGLHGFA